MKTLVYIFFLFVSTLSFSQENPWERKATENPWKTENNNADSVQVPVLDEESLLSKAKDEAATTYKSKGSFAFGFTAGLVLNVYGFLADGIYIVHDSKQEERIVAAIKKDSTYQTVDAYDLETKTAKRIKIKKFIATVGGTITGSIVQLGIIAGVLTLS